MGNPSFGRGWHERGLFEGPRTEAKVRKAFEAGQRSGGRMNLLASGLSAVIMVGGQIAYDRWKEKRSAARANTERPTS